MSDIKKNTPPIQGRFNWVDWYKSIGIFLIVIGHTALENESILFFLFLFHVPVFFFISGYLEKNTPCNSIEYLRKVCVSLVLPYIIWNFISLFFHLPMTFYNVFSFFIGYTLWNGASWFLGVLIIIKCTSLLFKNKYYVLWLVTIIGLMAVFIYGKRLPFYTNIVFMFLPFYYVGMIGKSIIRKMYDVFKDRFWRCSLLAGLGIITLFVIYQNTQVPHTNMILDFRNNVLWYWLTGFIGAFSLFFLCLILDRFSSSIIINISTATLFIMCSHYEIFHSVTCFISKDYGDVAALGFSLIYFCLQCLLIPFVLKYVPILAGRMK